MNKKDLKEIQESFIRCMNRMKHLRPGDICGELSHNECAVMICVLEAEKAQEEEQRKRQGKKHGKDLEQKETGMLTVSALAKEMNWTLPALSRLLKNMERKDLIRRETVSIDRRNTVVLLSEKGRDELEKGRKIMDQFMEEVFLEMGQEDMKEYIRLQNQFCEIIERRKKA